MSCLSRTRSPGWSSARASRMRSSAAGTRPPCPRRIRSGGATSRDGMPAGRTLPQTRASPPRMALSCTGARTPVRRRPAEHRLRRLCRTGRRRARHRPRPPARRTARGARRQSDRSSLPDPRGQQASDAPRRSSQPDPLTPVRQPSPSAGGPVRGGGPDRRPGCWLAPGDRRNHSNRGMPAHPPRPDTGRHGRPQASEHGEHGIRAQSAPAKATWILRGAGIGLGAQAAVQGRCGDADHAG